MSRLSRKNSSNKAVDNLNDSAEDFLPSNPIPRTLSTTSKKPECKKTKAVKPERKQLKSGSLDPNLELAVALSASLNPKNNVVLPGASSWNAPKKKKVPSQTPLEIRSIEERNRLIADKVSSILLDEGNKEPSYLAGSLYPPLSKVKLKSAKLLRALNSKDTHSLWALSSQRLRASSRFYVPNLLPSCKKLEAKIDKEEKPLLSPLSILSNNLLSLVNESRGSDITLFVKGDKKIFAHSIIFYSRFPCLLKDLILEGQAQLLMWPEVYFESALSFLRFIYGAVFPENISTKSELHGLSFLSRKYKISDLSFFLKNVDERDLIDDSDEIVEEREEESHHVTATQNLNDLIDALERENDDGKEVESEEEQNDLSEIQDFILSQRPNHNQVEEKDGGISHSPPLPRIEEEEEEEEEDSFIDLTQGSCDDASVKDRESGSPDMFNDNDDEADLFLTTEEMNVSRKRKSESGCSFSKMSKLEDKDFDELSLPTPSKGDISPVALSDVEILSPEKDEAPSASSSQEEFHTPKSTRVDSKRVSLENKPSTQKPITPMLDYESMLTPALRAELKKFGLKAVPRTKACRLLKYIYEETHKEQAPPEAETSSSQVSSLESSFEEMAEESIHVPLDGPDEEGKSSTLELNLEDKVKRFIRSNAALWKQVLEYEPIWLEDFVASFKSSEHGVRKCKESQILDIFDNECITFRSRKSQNRRGGAKKSPRKTLTKS